MGFKLHEYQSYKSLSNSNFSTIKRVGGNVKLYPMDRLFKNDKNPNEHLNYAPQVNSDTKTTLDARIDFIKTLIQETEFKISEEEKTEIISDSDNLRIKILKAILEDLYDTKYIGAPKHKQQLSLHFKEGESSL